MQPEIVLEKANRKVRLFVFEQNGTPVNLINSKFIGEMKSKRISIIYSLVFVASTFCLASFRLASITSPSIIIYKTKRDYSKYVPVTLSADKDKVVSYPDINDVYYEGQLSYPVALAKGYWLDHRGIGRNTAFIKLTYEDYSKLPQTPSPAELYTMILDSNPFLRIYDMGDRANFKEPVPDINRIIENNQLKKYKRLK